MKNIGTICKTMSFLLIILFFMKIGLDYLSYSSTLNSAPFYVWIILDAVYLLVPAIILWVVGCNFRNKK